VSLIQGSVQINRHDSEADFDDHWPSIDSVADVVEKNIVDAVPPKELKSATNTILTKPLVRVLGAFNTSLSDLDKTIRLMWDMADSRVHGLAKLLGRTFRVSSDGVNMALNLAVQVVERVATSWINIAISMDSVAKILQNQLSLVGFKDLAASLPESLVDAMQHLHDIADRLLDVKDRLQLGAQPWTSNAETDKPMQEAILHLKEASHNLASKKKLLSDWFQRIVDKIDKVSKTLPGDQHEKIALALTPLSADIERLLDDLSGGLFSFAVKFGENLARVKVITAAAQAEAAQATAAQATAAQSDAMEPRSLSIAVGALALIALAPVIA